MARVRDSSLAAFPGRTTWNPYVRNTYWEPPIIEDVCGKTAARSHRHQSYLTFFQLLSVFLDYYLTRDNLGKLHVPYELICDSSTNFREVLYNSKIN